MAEVLKIAVSLLPGLETSERALIEECTGSVEDFQALSRRDVEKLVGRRLKLRKAYPDHRGLVAEACRILAGLKACDSRPVAYFDREYPPQLRESKSPPYILFLRGNLPSFDLPMISIVGTRRPSPEASEAAFTLAAEFALMGIPVVSGLAYGIDSAAHWGAVKTGSYTLAVLGTPIDRIYPESNRLLSSQILENGGALVSEKAPFSPVGKYDFPRRNRIIAGLSRGLVVVQAPAKSGALITAEWAMHSNRAIYVHSAGLRGEVSLGTKALADEGVMRVDNAGMILRDWGVSLEGARLERIDDGSIGSGRLMEGELSRCIIRFERNYYRRVG
jgi:DNA processing protein